MTIYNINLGIGWASSGVEYAQAYRSKVFANIGVDAKFIFMDFIPQANISDLTRNIGFKDEQIIWLYTYFTDQKIGPTTMTLAKLLQSFDGEVDRVEKGNNSVRYFMKGQDTFLTAYLQQENTDIVHRVEYVSGGHLIRKDFYTDIRSFTEYYTPRDNQAHLYMRRFFNRDGSVGLEEIIDGDSKLYRLKDEIFYSKEELIGHFIKALKMTVQDIVILDRATGTGQAVLRNVKPAKVGVVIHAEHFSENAVTEDTILWNNYYEYQFTNADKIDFFVTATEKQKELVSEQFQKYTKHRPVIYAIPVGSLDQLREPTKERKPFSLITASRLATEKHVDWLTKAVIEARKVLPELTFDIYGVGGQDSKIRDIIKENQAESYIRLCGHHDLTDIYQDYQLYLSASKSEGFGLTLLEAVGSGLPLIGFDVRYGNQTFIRDGENGYMIPRPDIDDEKVIVVQFAEKIIQIFRHHDLEKLHQVSYALASDYLRDKVEAKWGQLIKEVSHA